jgi:hypothetical protein
MKMLLVVLLLKLSGLSSFLWKDGGTVYKLVGSPILEGLGGLLLPKGRRSRYA